MFTGLIVPVCLHNNQHHSRVVLHSPEFATCTKVVRNLANVRSFCIFRKDSALSRGGMEEIEVVVGTYNCTIHGFAIDFVNPEAKAC